MHIWMQLKNALAILLIGLNVMMPNSSAAAAGEVFGCAVSNPLPSVYLRSGVWGTERLISIGREGIRTEPIAKVLESPVWYSTAWKAWTPESTSFFPGATRIYPKELSYMGRLLVTPLAPPSASIASPLRAVSIATRREWDADRAIGVFDVQVGKEIFVVPSRFVEGLAWAPEADFLYSIESEFLLETGNPIYGLLHWIGHPISSKRLFFVARNLRGEKICDLMFADRAIEASAHFTTTSR